MSRFTAEGKFEVEILDAMVAQPKFCTEEGSFDIALKVRDDEGHEDWWRGEVSSEYGRGNFSDRTQAELTLESLERAGWTGGTNFGQINQMVGLRTSVKVKGKDGYFNINVLAPGDFDPIPIDLGKLDMSRFFPGAAAQANPAPAQRPAARAAAKPAAPAAAAAAPAPSKGGNPFLA